MNRMRAIVSGAGLVLTGWWLVTCAGVPVRPDGTPEPQPVEAVMAAGARTMWIAPHPDDELFPGPLLARSAIHYGNPLYFLVLTHGEGGECNLKRGCQPDVGTVRHSELVKAAAHYRAELQHEHFFNAPLPVSSFPSRPELWKIWSAQGDPVRVVARAVRQFRPELVFTFDPDWGATGHPEHQLSARIACQGIRLAADAGADIDGLPPHRTGRVYQLANRNWVLWLVGRADPGGITETWDTTVPCTEGQSCLDYMIEGLRAHRTQLRDMNAVRENRWAFEQLSLRQVDPFAGCPDPAAAD